MKKLLIFGLMCLMLTSQVFAFNFFGFKLFEKPFAWQPNSIAPQAIENRMSVEKRVVNQPIVDVTEALALINADEYAKNYMGKFEGENFCVITDVRTIYGTVRNGTAVQLMEKPTTCHEIRVKEGYAIGLMNRYKARERIQATEVMQNVQTPLALKVRLMERVRA